MKKEFPVFILGLAAAFIVPLIFLIVVPYLQLSDAKPENYSEEDDVVAAWAYPAVWTGANKEGEEVYASQGCAYCHTQMVRPTYAGADMWRKGWGGNEEEGLARETRAADYTNDRRAMLGYMRIGQDLANVGTRNRDRAWYHQKLYNARTQNVDSSMPSYKNLYRKQQIAQPSENAIKLKGRFAVEEGYEVVPTEKAEALVDYLLSRKMDAPIPGAGTDEEVAAK
ncbi:MAG: cbb3-type cytochrome c oxidase subunit II [Verrucomicrobiota bacterium]